MKGKYLITTDSVFTAPDGVEYRAVWGDVTVLEDTFLGIKTNRGSSNWFIKVGSDDKHVIVAGCQVHYAIKCNEKPADGMVKDWSANATNSNIFERPSYIYIAE